MYQAVKKKHVYEAELGPGSDLQTFFKDNSLVISTGFFRNEQLFKDLKKNILPELFFNGVAKNNMIYIWSAGCSDGREPYSIAMTIDHWLRVNKPGWRFMIRASDINRHQIEKGKLGRYKINTKERSLLLPVNDLVHWADLKTVTMSANIRKTVDFKVEDITREKMLNRFEIIFCTNVLLYYDKDYRKFIVRSLSKALKEKGFLYIESIGTKYMKSEGFQKTKPESHFYRKE